MSFMGGLSLLFFHSSQRIYSYTLRKRKHRYVQKNKTRRTSIFSVSHSSKFPSGWDLERWEANKQRNYHCSTVSFLHICKSCFFPSETKIAGIPHFLLTHVGQPKWRFPVCKRNVPPEKHFWRLATQREWHVVTPDFSWQWMDVMTEQASPKPE